MSFLFNMVYPSLGKERHVLYFFNYFDSWYYWGTACVWTQYHQGIAGLNCNHVLTLDAFLHYSFVTATNKSRRKSLLLSLLQSNNWRRMSFHFCNILSFNLSLFTDPFSMPPQKALETIGKTLGLQYERWLPKVRCFTF